jgi:hypothetical protein
MVDVSSPFLSFWPGGGAVQHVLSLTGEVDRFAQNARRLLWRVETHGILRIDEVHAPLRLALHHLPDMWKAVALRNIHALLANEGKLFLSDVIFPFSADSYEEDLEHWIHSVPDKVVSTEIKNHIKNEFSTFDWIIEAMLDRTGFVVESKDVNGFISAYICRKAP